MAFTVYHCGLCRALNLSEADLGHPDLPGLWGLLRADKRPVPERQLQCIECMRSRPGCPEWMELVERDGLRFARHFTKGVKDHPSANESDQHKAFKERIAKAAEIAGHGVEIEDRADHGKRRTDVLIKGVDGLLIGHEVQLSYATVDAVRKRAKTARADGIRPLWTTVDRTAQLIDQVPWARTDNMDWQYISTGRELLVRGGVRDLVMVLCDRNNPLPCPVRGYGRCGKRHGSWDLKLGVQLDDLVRDSASGEYVPILVPQGKRMNRMWVSPENRDRYAESVGGLLDEDESPVRRSPRPADIKQRPLETECRYGEDSGFRSSPAAIRDVGGAIDASSVTAARMALQAPPPYVPRPGLCSAGFERCGAPARLYPCGWRCEVHAP